MVLCFSPSRLKNKKKKPAEEETHRSRSLAEWECVCVQMGADRPSILCPRLELARQRRAVPSLTYPASQQALLVWAQCCANAATWLVN